MINIKIQNNRKSANHCLSDLTDGIMDETLRLSKEHLESEYKNAQCDIHKSESKGTITIKANNNIAEFEYSDFCCKDFENKFK